MAAGGAKRIVFTVLLGWAIAASAAAANELPPEALGSLLQKHCAACHDEETRAGDLSIGSLAFDLKDLGTRERWIELYERVERREMPPAPESLADADRSKLLQSLEPPLRTAASAAVKQQGRGTLRRLTRAEFENNLRVVLKLPQLDVRDKVPEDRESHGFTKVAALLDMSRVQMEAYLAATDAALQLAKASPAPPPVREWRFTGTELFPELETFGEREAMFFARQNRWVPISHAQWAAMSPEQRRDPSLEMALFRSATWPYYGYPRGFRAPLDGEYQVRFRGRAVRQVRDFRLAPAHEPIAMSFRARQPSGPDVSGDVRETGGWMDLMPEPRDFETTIRLQAGETFEYSPLGLPVPFIRTDGGFFYDFPPMPPEGHRGIAIQWLEVKGPIVGDSWPPPSVRVLFDDVALDRLTAADTERLFRRFAATAALRPLDEESQQPFLKLIDDKLSAGRSPAEALLAGYQALLCSSHCLYLVEPRSGTIADHDAIAARLSHFLWNERPDETLRQLAQAGRLRDPLVLREQAERMLIDRRSEQLVRGLADEWLDLRRLRRDIPDERLYPEYRKDDYLVDSMERETLAFLSAMIRENLPATTVVSADFTYVNDRLARHYDLPRVPGSALRRVDLPPDHPYGGLLTQAALLKHTANGTTTSPVVRGAWVMEKLLGQTPPPPPKSVPAIEPDIRGARSIRELLAKHAADQTCAGCHARFDPVGFALENFDVMGGWRDRYRGLGSGEKVTGFDPAGHPYAYFAGPEVDASGRLLSGESFRDVRELKLVLAARPRELARNVLHQLTQYATAAPVGFADRAEIELLLDACEPHGYRVRDLIHALIQSRIFLGE